MMGWLCWLFGTCAATLPVAPPPPVVVQQVPAVHEAAPNAAPATGGVRVALMSPPAPSVGAAMFGADAPKLAPIVVTIVPPDLPAPTGAPAWQRYAVPAPPSRGRPTISVVIDDMGVAAAQSARAIALPGPLTLSWLPYAPHLAEQVSAGAAHGHEAMLHMPMEALGRADPGPDALRTWLPPATNLANLRAALDLVPTAVALNQHEGSVASLSVPLMDLVMGELRARRMAFLDSGVIPHAVALARAEAAGVPAVARDLFIDNDPDPAAIRARLAEVEEIARRHGHAILIGHPRQTTMDVLEQYLPTLGERGFVLWPISATIAASLTAAPVPVPTASAAISPLKPSGTE